MFKLSFVLLSLELFTKFLLKVDGVDSLGITIVSRKFALLHVLDAPLPFVLSRVGTVMSDFLQLFLNWFLIDSRLTCLGNIRCIVVLHVLHRHHLTWFLRHESGSVRQGWHGIRGRCSLRLR